MNEYGRSAKKHWERWLPTRVAQIPESERQAFFADLGERAQEQILALEERLEAQTDLNGLDYLETLGRLNAIRAQARESVLTDLVYLDPEPETASAEDEDRPDHPLSEWMDPSGMPWDRSHDLWRMLEDDETSTEDFQAATAAWEDSLWRRIGQPTPPPSES